jgi:predicted small lipoprotein YifL
MPAFLRVAFLLAALATLAACGHKPAGNDHFDAADIAADAETSLARDAGEASDASDATEAVDAAKAIDAGTPADAGQAQAVDASPMPDAADAGASIALQVVANPNSVLSAIATVSWVGSLDSISIQFNDGGTPEFDLSRSTSPVELPVLGLKASTTYTLQARGVDADANTVQSNAVALTTGELPVGFPKFEATGIASGSGLTLVALQNERVNATVVVDGEGTPVWYYSLPNNASLLCDFQQQPDGTFTASIPAAFASAPTIRIPGLSGVYLQVDVLGNLLHTWTARGAGRVTDTGGHGIDIQATDVHDIRVQPDGSALMFGWIAQQHDLSPIGGNARAQCYADVLERVAKDGTVLWAWNSAEFFTPADVDPACASLTMQEVDMIHANAIDVTRDGNYLVSLRNLSQIVKIDSTTGEIIWKLGGAGLASPTSGGPRGDFTFPNDPTAFSCQHGARELSNGNIILFDNGDGHVLKESRAVEYSLAAKAMSATMVWHSKPMPGLYTNVLGYGQRISNGNTLVAYGSEQVLDEWGPDATEVLWSLSSTLLHYNIGYYRAYRIGSLYSYSPP